MALRLCQWLEHREGNASLGAERKARDLEGWMASAYGEDTRLRVLTGESRAA